MTGRCTAQITHGKPGWTEYLIIGGGGGGGGGSSSSSGGTGGSGVVVVRYQSGTRLASGGNTSGTAGAWKWEQFTTSGTLNLSFDNANLLATQSGTISGAGRLTLSGKVWNSATNHPNVVLNKTGVGTLEIAGRLGAPGDAGKSGPRPRHALCRVLPGDRPTVRFSPSDARDRAPPR